MTPKELKNSILQLAIQGKLVEQCPEEGTGEELYQQIQLEPINTDKGMPQISDDEPSFDIPSNWKWIRIKNIAVINNGRAYKQNELLDTGKYPVLRVGNLFTNSNWYYSNLELEADKYCDNGDLLYSWSASFGPFIWNGSKVIYHYHIWKLYYSRFLYREFLYYFLLADTDRIKTSGHGLAMIHVTKAGTEERLIPLPPLAEQKRIVAKIEELLPYIDRYEQAWRKLEDFNKRFPIDMQKSILQFAIQGKLVEQRPEEGTGEDLYRHIQAEKQRLIKAGTIKKEKPLPEIAEDEKPFDIPESWKWVRLPEVGELSRGRSQHRPRNDSILYENGIVPMIQTGDVARANGYITDWSVMYNEAGVAQSRIWKAGTICLTIAANIGDVAILKFDACFPDSVVGFNAYSPVVSNEYFMYGLMCYKSILDIMSRSTAQKNINIDILSRIAFPLPPLAEQKRIVAKLEEILPLCEKLK